MFTQTLEKALCEAIVKHDVETATTLIELIKKHETASLFAINDNHENFLHIALKQKATDIFKLLYASVKNEKQAKSYLSRPDCDGNSLFQLALYLDTPNEAITLFNDFAQTYSLDESIKVFFRGNNEGNTPLHIAACDEQSGAFTFIMKQISQDVMKQISQDVMNQISKASGSQAQRHSSFFASNTLPKLSNALQSVEFRLSQVNNEGESALHIAAGSKCFSNAIQLLNAGASPYLKNKKGELELDLGLFIELLLDLLEKLELSLADVKKLCMALDAEPGFKGAFNHSILKHWIDDPSALGSTILFSVVVGLILSIVIGFALGLTLAPATILASGTWVIPLFAFIPPIGGPLLGMFATLLFAGVVKAIDLLCQDPSIHSVDLSTDAKGTLNKIEALSSFANWPEAAANRVGQLIKSVGAKEEITADDATALIQSTQDLIHDIPYFKFRVEDDESLEDEKSLQMI